MTLVDSGIDPYCVLPYSVSNKTFYYDFNTQSGTVTYSMPTVTSCTGFSYTSATTTLTTISGSTTLPTFVSWDSTN